MQLLDDGFRFSPSDLTAHLACPHLTTLAVEVARGARQRPRVGDEYTQLIQARGEEYERAYLDELRAAGRTVTTIRGPGPVDWVRDAEATRAAMARGDEVVYQAVLVDGRWRGLADFVERIDEPSALGGWSYEAVDTKLARGEKPSYVLQLCFYSTAIEAIQRRRPARIHVVLGSGRRESYPVEDFVAYWSRARERFARAIDVAAPSRALPCPHCDLCDFRHVCREHWEAIDHLSRVAGARRDQVRRLESAGLPTLTALATAPDTTRVPRLAPETFAGLREQADLQLRSDPPARIELVWRPAQERRGFGLLPRRSAGDVILDFEGDPFWRPTRGLEFLTGVLLPEQGYRAIWAHDEAEERTAIETLLDLIHERLARWPDMHVFHFASYETTAIKQAVSRYGTRADELDDLLRRRVFVDLGTVARQALRAGVRSYGLKHLEALPGFRRSADMGRGSEAVLDYEAWRRTRDPALLEGIAAYNREDCEATLALLDWLVEHHPPDMAWHEPIPRGAPRPESEERRSRHTDLREQLLAGAAEGDARWLAGELLEYHRREAKPAWWAYYARLDLTDEELLEDGESIGGLEPAPGVEPTDLGRGSIAHTFTFPEQHHKLGPGSEPKDPASEADAGEILELDDETGRLVLKRTGKLAAVPLPRALVEGGPIPTTGQEEALARLAESILAGDGRYPALEGILARDEPRLHGRAPGTWLQTSDPDGIARLAGMLDRSHLFVQGPPGSGKTYTGGRLIVDLIARGSRVGVAATSHKAIHNLLDEVERCADECGVPFLGWKKPGTGDGSRYESRHGLIVNVPANARYDDLPPDVRLVAGTAWLFARAGLDQQLDVLVIDEAGQVSLADALAMGTCARNVVLLGDPLQLAQVSQGTHPPGAGCSVLEHLLGEDATIAETRGVFLERTRRMHPDVCRFVSEVVYGGRLETIDACATQATGAGTGLRFLPVEHEGNRTVAPEEVDRIDAEIRALVGIPYTDAEGRTRPLAADDVMVVAPYNAQVRRLRARLPDGVRIGTVDKFQGQEAPIVFYSMTTSSGEDIPRNLEFLFSTNRLNVAVSRARCLAHVVASPRLLEIDCRTIEQMRLVNALCRFAELAG